MTTTQSTPSPETLAEILGAEHFVFGFPTAEAATNHAARRMAEGRPAVTYTDESGVHVCAYGIKGA